MASVNMEDCIQKPAVCVTVFGESHEGLLQGIDNNFNTVLKQSVGNKENELTFVRGESVVYVGFSDIAESTVPEGNAGCGSVASTTS
ncbi:Sm-like protein [Trypanosoma brucei gambiense DAL972]|uniref:U6 snRNA-associated Sm-like protein LSm6p n=1 Tax=Trypanosoma brucei gambiense (strain MHOM/CI/86/DAL972) TaxID=679716 RepID=C9ZXG0_TRYB9|nr:Sm-like protein [Trypanosoma brucei gambiense DAL972]CBH14104.1 Sm-like protein [Trypanosoma brucei gambiense DAL972]|eukprot:XP_011776375.1 Sm-like protein [Trypanosoma brucei gambiense DAL972]